MKSYWDLMFLNPILIVAALISIFFMLKNEKSELKRKLIYLEIFLFWFTSALILKLLIEKTQSNNALVNNDILFTITIFFGVNFFAIIFKPIATFITGKFKRRRIWYWVANTTLIMAIFFALINSLVLNGDNFAFIYLSFILIGFSLSANTLHYLIVCEQTFYRLNPIGSTITVASIMLFSNFIANYIFNLTMIFNPNHQIEIIMPIILLTAFIALGISFIHKENSNYVGTFDITIRNELDDFKYTYVIYLSLATFVIVLISEISGGLFFEEYLKIILANKKELNSIEIYIRLNQTFYYLPQIFLGYWIYKWVLPQTGYKYHFITNLLVLAIYLSIIAFIDNPLIIIIFQFLITLAIAQIFYGLFALAVMWNYRVSNFPVTGFVASSGFLATYISEGTFQSMKRNKVWIFNYDSDITSLVANENLQEIKDNYYAAWNITISILVSCCLLLIIIIYFTIDKVLSNYVDVKQANIDMIKLNYSQTLSKVETRIVEKEIKNV
ncbi:MFS cation transporter [Spiroplasma alleghenense]|uniref:Transmembrane protein n=1 Tax=Spiroplasma alleghenense TaxID=216931 RepID=A0A345Z4C0_9MOLU|nr:MFS cation transporter [Spiroplasma alleghenense]AXK51449.1 hypothetical protein SALLE_v1c07790 [Spiroplasma alleghenense]